MNEIDTRIKEIDNNICEIIELSDMKSRGFISQNILAHTRNLIEHVAMKAYSMHNINRFLQNNNPNVAYRVGVWTYKIGDPVLFNESERFLPVLYNNLKGTIVNIEQVHEGIFFSIEIDKPITELDADEVGLELLPSLNKGKSVIRFFVGKTYNTDDDNLDMEQVMPFQVSYAVSIHKAQGLEYNSVKIVITQDIDEMISHNIFYTAITRTKQNLMIYWTPESQEKILDSFKESNLNNVANIFAAHTQLKISNS